MLGPPSQHQQYPQYHGHPAQQAQYPANGIQHDGRPQHPQQGNGHSQSTDMNPYQQYAGSYGQSQQYPQQGQPQQIPQQHQAQYAQQHQQQQPQQPQQPQHRQHQQQQQQQIPQGQRSYMPNPNQSQNQLPPLGPPMGSSSMVPAVTESQSSQASPANPPQPPPYMAGPPQALHQSQPLAPPAQRPSVSAANNTPKEKKMSSSSERGPYRYSLEVVQQPQRARMCGFGDKDRRPITPPPCVRLVICDVETGREVPVGDIESDPSFFLLQCDLWAESADREANVVRASSNSPAVSISSATTTSYPPPAEPAHRHMGHDQPGVYVNAEGQPLYSNVPGYAMPVSGRPGMMATHGGMPGYPVANGAMFYPQGMQPQMSYMPQQNNNAMYTRNLIGSLTVNAAKLTDDAGKVGYWFVLQDLSVRTEGFFRLRMSFVDISNPAPLGGITRGATPVLAWTFSDKFQVYSAKKFPGVIESTALSKSFASQGIKIPIRKDNKNDAADDDDGD